jgi:hypothetical protein
MVSVIPSNGSLIPETKKRSAASMATANQLSPWLCTQDLNMKAKCLLASSFVFSALFYNCATLYPLVGAPLNKIKSTYHATIRKAGAFRKDGVSQDNHTFVQTVMKRTGFPECDVYISKIRLLYFTRFTMHAPPLLKRLVQREHLHSPDKSWVSSIINDLKWLFSFNLHPAHLPDPDDDLAPWATFIKEQAPQFRTLVKKSVKTSLALLVPSSLHPIIPILPDPTIPTVSVTCDLCDASFKSLKDLACHKAGKHKVKQPLRAKIATTHCLYCGKEWHTRYRIVSHVAYNSPMCKAFYIQQVPNIPTELYDELESGESKLSSDLRVQGKRPGYHPIPPVQCLFARPPMLEDAVPL